MELEYKVVQSTTPMFRNRSRLEQVLTEEAQNGWRLVEKFDNYKIRLQRDVSARANQSNEIDPYRSQVGLPNFITYGAATIVTLAIVYGIFVLVGAISV